METPVLSYPERRIKDISFRDVRVSVSGFVLRRDADSFLLDDGTGHVLVFGEPPGDCLRVFGDVSPADTGFQLRAALIQDFSSLDRHFFSQTIHLSHV